MFFVELPLHGGTGEELNRDTDHAPSIEFRQAQASLQVYSRLPVVVLFSPDVYSTIRIQRGLPVPVLHLRAHASDEALRSVRMHVV